jgi:hypothetical protein
MGKYLGNCVVLRGRTNALKFHGGRPPHIHVGAERNDHKWTFSVKDNGIGIEKQYGELVFQMFQRLHERGRYDGSGNRARYIACFQDNLTAVLFQSERARDLPADEKVVALRSSDMLHCAGNVHRRIREQHKSDIGQHAGCNFGLEGLSACRL